MNTQCLDLQLSAMTRDHLEAVMQIEREIYPFPWTRANFTDSLKAGYDAVVVHGPGRAAAGGPIGYSVLMHVLDEAHLLNLSLASAWHGRGLGRRLLHLLMERAAAHGARGMFLEVRPSNRTALNLYESESFLRVGLRRDYYPSYNRTREDAIVMRRALTP